MIITLFISFYWFYLQVFHYNDYIKFFKLSLYIKCIIYKEYIINYKNRKNIKLYEKLKVYYYI
jgi:hypothetical protein